MKKQINQRRQMALPATIISIFLFGAFSLTFAQEKLPKPDFSAMEKWYEIVKYEWADDPTANKITVFFKPKTAERPAGGAFVMKYLDKDGVSMDSAGFYGLFNCEVGETCKTEVATPHESDRAKIASVIVIRNKQ